MSIPILYREDGKIIPVQKKIYQLNSDEVDLTVTGNPLENHPTWKYATCPETGMKAVENNTLDTFVDPHGTSSIIPSLNTAPFDDEEIKYWMPVDQYVGGIEHAILHLLYSRSLQKR